MRIKIFAVPLLILAGLVFVIGFLVPSVSKLRSKVSTLKASEIRAQDVDGKVQRIDALKVELDAQAEQQNVLLTYLPDSRQEDGIINYLNRISSSSGVLLSNVSIEKEVEKNTGSEVTLEDLLAQAENSETSAIGGGPLVETPAAKAIKVGFKVVGNYDQVKSFLGQLAQVKRQDTIMTLKISKAAGADSATSGILSVEANVNFNYLPKITSIIGLDSSILQTDGFDNSIIKKIQEEKTTVVEALSVGSTGKNNPFTP
jgi:Tfp pilus assembly protein PilO